MAFIQTKQWEYELTVLNSGKHKVFFSSGETLAHAICLCALKEEMNCEELAYPSD